ncbi:MAG: hypothetical protein GY711_29830 [bacterium]|nr:hypothetical protein [bacterium]
MFKVIGALVVLAAVVLGIGYFTGWFTFTSTTEAGSTKIGLEVHGDEIKKDAKQLGEKAKGLVERIKGDALVTGTIRSIDGRSLDVETEDGKTVNVTLKSDAAIVIDGDASALGEIQVGDGAVVQLEKEGDMKSARKVVVVRGR